MNHMARTIVVLNRDKKPAIFAGDFAVVILSIHLPMV